MKIYIITLTRSFAASMHAMSKETSQVSEPEQKFSLKTSFAARKSQIIQESLMRVLAAFKKKGWNLPETMYLRHPREAHNQEVGMIATNGVDTIYAGSGHEAWYSSDEIDFMVGHEVGHITVKNHPWLNPHRYMEVYLHPVTFALGASVLTMAFLRSRRTLSGIAIGALGAGYALSIVKNFGEYSVTRDKHGEEMSRSYDSLLKLEELECDLIAGLVVGGKHGASYMQKTSEIFRQAEDSDHPRYDTRIRCLKALQWFQEHLVKRHT